MAYLDRFFIGAILPLAAVAYYVTPYEIVTKLLVMPQAMVIALFPAFASTYARDRARTGVLFERALRVTLLVMFPLLLTIVLFAREGLTLWVGAAFAAESTATLQWLAVGVFINAMAQAPLVVLQSTGRPDLTAKVHLLELPVYLAALWWLAHRFGIVGVAMAWSVRAGVDAVALLLLAGHRLADPRRLVGIAVSSIVGVPVVLATAAVLESAAAKALFLATTLAVFAVLGWTQLVHAVERDELQSWLRLRRRAASPPG
jgi:O-antigen/teichoic acid export membrane protein